jgi:hypothetical protein
VSLNDPWPGERVSVSLTRDSAAALHAIAESYGADGNLVGTEIGRALDDAIQPLRDVVTHEECVRATEALRGLWSE